MKTSNKKSSTAKKNTILIILTILLIIVPLVCQKGAEFGGSDDQAKGAITQIDPGYKPWFHSIWEPPSGEVESLLFCVQAGIGSGVVGYILGYFRGKKKNDSDR